MQDDGSVELEEQSSAEDHEQALSLADQSASDTDQTGSDSDQSVSEQDALNAGSDQEAADADQAVADRLPIPESERAAHDASRIERERNTVRRLLSHAARSATADERLKSAAERDATAASRDEMARRRDRRAEDVLKRTADSGDVSLLEQLERARASAASDRARAAKDRAEAAAERSRLEAALHHAHLDELTGAFRREMGWLALDNEVERARRGDGRFVMAFIDVDGLKSINDRDGHAAGDDVLRLVVAALRTHLRSFDPIVRYGGDEFIAGLGAASLEDVGGRFDRIARSLNELGLDISVGLASLAPGETLDELTARADAELLIVKRRHHAPPVS